MVRYIYSAGGYARELVRLVRLQYPEDEVQFVDDNERAGSLTFAQASQEIEGSEMLVGFASPALRAEKHELVKRAGFKVFSVVANTAIVGDNVLLGEGSVMSDFTMVTSDATIGDGFQCNIYSYIAHDCLVGDFVTLAPRVSVNGRVTLEDNVYIGTGATILPGSNEASIVIGEGAKIGAHALVTKSVAPRATVVGCPAKPI